LEKATELGVHEITLLNCDHGERQRVNLERLQKILIAAIKQSGRPWLPKLNLPISLESLFKSRIAESIYVAQVDGMPLTDWSHSAKFQDSLCFCIGPEGDFSEKELALIKKMSIPSVSFGGYRLRTETAGVYVAAYFAQMN
jgi:16S rRNA (uracil1498-N3)-methyltransferase